MIEEKIRYLKDEIRRVKNRDVLLELERKANQLFKLTEKEKEYSEYLDRVEELLFEITNKKRYLGAGCHV